jgi:hypothetical protein
MREGYGSDLLHARRYIAQICCNNLGSVACEKDIAWICCNKLGSAACKKDIARICCNKLGSAACKKDIAQICCNKIRYAAICMQEGYSSDLCNKLDLLHARRI